MIMSVILAVRASNDPPHTADQAKQGKIENSTVRCNSRGEGIVVFQSDKTALGTQNNDVATADWSAQELPRPSTDSALVPNLPDPRRIPGNAT
ncbi:hypothetical protein [Streptomyces mirabilis]